MGAWWWDTVKHNVKDKCKLRQSRNREVKVSKSILKQIARLEELFIRPNVNERSRSSYSSQRDEQNCEVFKVAKIIIRNDDNMLAVRSENKLAWKSYYEKVSLL